MYQAYIRAGSNVKVTPFMGKKLPENARLYLMVGPTGAGKSSFIESLAGETQKLSISKDQLDGYTQAVTIYHLQHVYSRRVSNFREGGDPIYLVDTPGFSDSKISELEVMDMIRMRLDNVGKSYVYRVFFFIPINTPRLAGSRRRTIDMFKVLLRGKSRDITFMTTMWDSLHNGRVRERAASNFVQLREDVLAEFIASGATIKRFYNRKQSPEKIFWHRGSTITAFSNHVQGIHPHGLILYQDLLDRIKSAQQKERYIEGDLETPEAKAFPELQAIQERNYEENHDLLWKFLNQYLNFMDPPPELLSATFDLDRSIIEATGYSQLHSPYRDLLYNYRYKDIDSVRRNWLTLHQHLQYSFICQEVKRALQKTEITALHLALLDTTTSSEEKSVLEQQQIENRQFMIGVIGQWIRFDDPPHEIDAVTQKLRRSVISSSDLGRLDSAYGDIFYLWKHYPSWSPSVDERPEDTGVFTHRNRTGLSILRRNYEASATPRVLRSALHTHAVLSRSGSRPTS